MSLGLKSTLKQETFSPGDFFQKVSISTLKHKDLGPYLREGGGRRKEDVSWLADNTVKIQQ